MKFDSIKSQLMLMTLVCVLGMALLVASQFLFTQRLNVLNQQREALLRLGQDLLQMRRHEKDFLLRHQMDHVHRFEQRAETFSYHLQELSPLFAQFNLPATQAGMLAQGMEEYRQLFQRLVSLQAEIGLNDNTGLLLRFYQLESELNGYALLQYGEAGYADFAAAQLAARNFLLNKTRDHKQEFNQSSDILLQLLRGAEQTEERRLLLAYIQTFNHLALAIEAMGITHNDGLQGLFRSQAHQVEHQLEAIDQALQPLIEAQQAKVRAYSIFIAALTSVSLILLLVKSFATFHRAFANFVMFFYRCKRQYQKIDPHQLGFAEFKSLAELANEMVESRRDIEIRLANAEARLAQTSAKT
ncbi:chemotaxis protein [Alteromonas aestuariivivens]|uniref:Chemotaxis protein n=1 Tax=Alteromonas aestuariivivens TaxID=1938339 RepID=A0A3D8M393_9ALTE|nr:chemotaxis protein [Alteromonas aestuariivivens]